MDIGDGGAEGLQRGILLVLIGRVGGDRRSMSHEGVHAEVEGNLCRVRRELSYLKSVYRVVEDRGIQKVPTLFEPR